MRDAMPFSRSLWRQYSPDKINPKKSINESQNPKPGLHRRDLLKGAAAASLGLATGAISVSKLYGQTQGSGSSGRNLIRTENAKPGTRDWMLTNTYIDPDTWWRSPSIEGYCSEMSVSAGDTLKVMVSTNPVSEFSLEIFRTGYYGGDGARSMMRFDSLPGKIQPDPPIGENRLRECKWEPSVEFEIPSDWLSGVYLGKLTAKKVEGVYQSKLTAKKDGLQSYVIFTVRDDRPCDLLFQCSDITWHAYNSWPDDRWSLYHNDKDVYNEFNERKKWTTGPDSGWVSFDRPYANFCQDHLVDRPSSVGSGEFLLWEFPLSYWMEQHGYEVSYISNVDTHTDGAGLRRAKGFISVGHDEYWTREMYDNVSAARDAGVNLAFLSGNPVLSLPGLEILAHSTQLNREGKPRLLPHSATVYNGPKGNLVFNAGGIWWAQGLSSPPGHVLPGYPYEKDADRLQGPDPRVQRIMTNVFDRFIK
jgi:hypothetical protein